tara:strand:+ start:5088 stop:6584 length:1497 start_codon:yes stop_codon:yes gene_type:complete
MAEEYFVASGVYEDTETLEAFAEQARSEGADRIILIGSVSLVPFSREAWSTYFKSNQDENANREFVAAKREHARSYLKKIAKVLDHTEIPYSVIPGFIDSAVDLEETLGENNLHAKSVGDELKLTGYGGGTNIRLDALLPPFQYLQWLREAGEESGYKIGGLTSLLTKENPDVLALHVPTYDIASSLMNSGLSPKLVFASKFEIKGKSLNMDPEIIPWRNPLSKEETKIFYLPTLGRLKLVEDLTKLKTKDLLAPYGNFLRVRVDSDGELEDFTIYSMANNDRSIGEVTKKKIIVKERASSVIIPSFELADENLSKGLPKDLNTQLREGKLDLSILKELKVPLLDIPSRKPDLFKPIEPTEKPEISPLKENPKIAPFPPPEPEEKTLTPVDQDTTEKVLVNEKGEPFTLGLETREPINLTQTESEDPFSLSKSQEGTGFIPNLLGNENEEPLSLPTQQSPEIPLLDEQKLDLGPSLESDTKLGKQPWAPLLPLDKLDK